MHLFRCKTHVDLYDCIKLIVLRSSDKGWKSLRLCMMMVTFDSILTMVTLYRAFVCVLTVYSDFCFVLPHVFQDTASENRCWMNCGNCTQFNRSTFVVD